VCSLPAPPAMRARKGILPKASGCRALCRHAVHTCPRRWSRGKGGLRAQRAPYRRFASRPFGLCFPLPALFIPRGGVCGLGRAPFACNQLCHVHAISTSMIPPHCFVPTIAPHLHALRLAFHAVSLLLRSGHTRLHGRRADGRLPSGLRADRRGRLFRWCRGIHQRRVVPRGRCGLRVAEGALACVVY